MFKKYQRKNLAEMRDLLPEETKTALKNKKVSISQPDMELSDYDFSLGKVARNPDNPADMWYVAKDYFEKNFAESDNGPLDLFVKPTFAKIPLRLMYKVLDKYLTHDLHTPYGQMFNHWEQLIEHLREDLASYENYGIIDDVNDK